MSKVPARDEKNKTQNNQPIKITAVRVTEDTQDGLITEHLWF